MGVIAFGRPPQEALEQIKQALDLVSIIHHIATNPDMAETIDALSEKLVNAQELSEEKKKEVHAAEETLAQAREAKEDLAQEKRTHDAKTVAEWSDIKKARTDLENSQNNFNSATIRQREATTLAELEANRKLEAATKLNSEGVARHAKAEQLERETKAKIEEHEQHVSDWNLDKAQQEAELNDKWNAHTAAMTKLAEDRKMIDSMRKKLEAALNAG